MKFYLKRTNIVIVSVLAASLYSVIYPLPVRGQYTQIGSSNTTESQQKKAKEQFFFAEGMWSRGFYELAAAEYKKLTSKYVDFEEMPTALYHWGDCYYRTNKNDQALDVFLDLRKTFPGHPSSYQAAISMTTILVGRGELDEAIRLLLKTVEAPNLDDQTMEGVNYYLGETYLKLNNLEMATKYLTKLSLKTISNNFPFRAYAVLNLGYTKGQEGDDKKAVELFSRVVDSPKVPPEIQEEAIFQLGEIAYRTEDYPKAIDYYYAVINQFPEGNFSVRARINCAWSLVQEGKFSKAVSLCEGLSAKEASANGELLYIKGLSLKSLLQYDSAISTFQEYAQKHPNGSYRSYSDYDVIECLLELKRFKDCAKEALKFLKQHPENDLSYKANYYLGHCRSQLDQPNEAIIAYERSLTKIDSEQDFEVEAILTLADIYRKLKKYEKAADTYLRILDFDDKNLHSQGLMMAAESLRAGNLLNETIITYKKLIQDYPESAEVPIALINMAQIKSDQKDYDDSIGLISRYISEFPKHENYGKALYLRGTLHHTIGKNEEAIKDLENSIDHLTAESKEYAQIFLIYTLWELNRDEEVLALLAELFEKESTALNENLDPEFLAEVGNKYLEIGNSPVALKSFTLLSKNAEKQHQLIGRLGVAKVAFSNKNYTKATQLLSELKFETKENPELSGIILSFLGESLRRSGNNDEAFVIFEEASNLTYENSSAKALTRLGIAKIYYDNKEYDEALRYAISIYILYDDPDLTPEGMLLALKILVNQQRREEAQSTYQELQGRYPGALTFFKSKDENKDLFSQL